MNTRDIVLEYWKTMQSNDFRKAAEFFSDDYTCYWPQSHELIEGRENFININANYPVKGEWKFSVLSIIAEGEKVVSEVKVEDDSISALVITFHIVRCGKIISQREYWPDDYTPQSWREQWVKIINK